MQKPADQDPAWFAEQLVKRLRVHAKVLAIRLIIAPEVAGDGGASPFAKAPLNNPPRPSGFSVLTDEHDELAERMDTTLSHPTLHLHLRFRPAARDDAPQRADEDRIPEGEP